MNIEVQNWLNIPSKHGSVGGTFGEYQFSVISVEGYSPALHERHGPANMGALGERDISVLDQCSDLTLLEHSL